MLINETFSRAAEMLEAEIRKNVLWFAYSNQCCMGIVIKSHWKHTGEEIDIVNKSHWKYTGEEIEIDVVYVGCAQYLGAICTQPVFGRLEAGYCSGNSLERGPEVV